MQRTTNPNLMRNQPTKNLKKSYWSVLKLRVRDCGVHSYGAVPLDDRLHKQDPTVEAEELENTIGNRRRLDTCYVIARRFQRTSTRSNTGHQRNLSNGCAEDSTVTRKSEPLIESTAASHIKDKSSDSVSKLLSSQDRKVQTNSRALHN